jgi:hypothetical protein
MCRSAWKSSKGYTILIGKPGKLTLQKTRHDGKAIPKMDFKATNLDVVK